LLEEVHKRIVQNTILVVDDEAPMRKLISSNLKARGYRVLTAADGDEALKLVDEHQLDLLLLDIGLPGPDGLTVVQSIRRHLEVPVLMLSARGREADKVRALELGADDYLTKPFGVDELIARVRALLRRTTPGAKLPLPNYQYQGLEVDFSARRARLHGAEVPLTRREYEVLAFMARNSGKVLLHREILQGVWGNEYGEEADYVWTFVQRIRRKIEADRSHPKYVLTEAGVGYRMPMVADSRSGADR
jgi:two-component system KDP operon response regulator KdpE